MPDEILAPHGHLSDPHRRWLRRTYQEGPGFRFLATRGGRPPGRSERRSELALVRERSGRLRVLREQGLVAALALGRCSRASLFRWQAAYRRGGLAALVPARCGPRAPRVRHPGWVEQIVIAVRLATYWNAKRISAELRRREIAQVSHFWIERLFDDLGTSRPSGPRERGPRYERGSPNSLWHIDIKGPFWIQLGRGRYLKTFLVGLVDDHSRYVIGLRILPAAGAEPILAWLAECIELCGRPLDLMSDNGTPFVVWMPGVLTRSGKTLRDLAVRHIRTQVNSPWTNGKIDGTLTSAGAQDGCRKAPVLSSYEGLCPVDLGFPLAAFLSAPKNERRVGTPMMSPALVRCVGSPLRAIDVKDMADTLVVKARHDQVYPEPRLAQVVMPFAERRLGHLLRAFFDEAF